MIKIFQIIYLICISLFETKEPARLNKKKNHQAEKKMFTLKSEDLTIIVFIIIFTAIVIYVGMTGSLESTQYYYRLG